MEDIMAVKVRCISNPNHGEFYVGKIYKEVESWDDHSVVRDEKEERRTFTHSLSSDYCYFHLFEEVD